MKLPSLTKGPVPWLKPAVLIASLVPVTALALQAASGSLGANPIATAMNQLGLMTLVFLLASLSCSPLKTVFGWTWPLRIRRMLGLFAFFYAFLHFGTYLGLDQFFDFPSIGSDIVKRKFIFVGFAAFVLLIPLAATSTDAMVRRLGFARWKLLHRLAYLAAILGVIHFIWRVKKDLTQPLEYAAVLAVLLGIRLVQFALQTRRRKHLAGELAGG
jgi:sulfoxide reductase heme-binding subunit YedZ